MSTVTRITADGVQTTELVPGTASPAAARPQPPPRPSATMIDVPTEGTAAEIALAVLGMVAGDGAAASFRSRAAAAQGQVEELVESARLRSELRLDQFISRAAVQIRLRNVLRARADVLERRPGTQPPDVAVELCSLVRAVKRWEDGQALRSDRARLMDAAARELAETMTMLSTTLPMTVRESHGSDINQGHHARGLVDREDEWLRRYETALARRDALRNQLARLGRDRTARAAAVASAIATARPANVASAIAPRMAVDQSRVAEVQGRLGRMAGELAATDAKTRRWRDIDAQQTTAQGELEQAERAVLKAQADAAAAVMARATTGELADILALERMVGTIPALAHELGQARGSDEELEATVWELLAEAEAKQDAEIARIQALQPRRPGTDPAASSAIAAGDARFQGLIPHRR